jgi:hypothetical protein
MRQFLSLTGRAPRVFCESPRAGSVLKTTLSCCNPAALTNPYRAGAAWNELRDRLELRIQYARTAVRAVDYEHYSYA